MITLLSADRLLRGPSGARVEDAAVAFRDGTILAAGARAGVEDAVARDGDTVVRREHPGATIAPGLVNGHVHLSFDPSSDPLTSMRDGDGAHLDAGMAERAAQLLDAGVTTVRDMGGPGTSVLRLRGRLAAGSAAHPRILAAGIPLTPPGGHCWFLGGEVATEEEMRALVRRNAAAGADLIKVMASGGHITSAGPDMWTTQFPVGQLRAIVDEASRYGLPVAAHAHGTESIAAAAAAGVRTVEHCTWMRDDGSLERPVETAAVLAGRGIAACCTIAAGDWPEKIEELGPAAARPLYDRLMWMHELGVPLLPGNDAGIPRATFDDFAGALQLYAWLGFADETVVELATAGAADVLGLGATTGRLCAGLAADVVVLDGDPTVGLEALRSVRLTVAGGREHRPGDRPR